MKTRIRIFGWLTAYIFFQLLSYCSADAFADNLVHVNAVNAMTLPWKLAMNRFSYLSAETFDTTWKGYKPIQIPVRTQHTHGTAQYPSYVDWRSTPLVGKIKDQEQCGSCWAFSAVAALEGQLAKEVNRSVSLSEQDLVDCVKNIPSPDGTSTCCYGCGGGEMYSVYQYLKNAQGGRDDTESQYPYIALDGKCSPLKSKAPGTAVKGYVTVKRNDELAMMDAIANIGPLSVGVAANTDWQLYKQGIYAPNASQCSDDPLDQDHGVAVVGYGSDKHCVDDHSFPGARAVKRCEKIDYWIVRNSWGEGWGEKGYMRLLRGTNACGIANSVIYPKLQ